MFPNGSAGQESACHAGDAGATGSTPGWGKSPEEEMATHSSILAGHLPWIVETARLSPRIVDPVHWVTKSQTQLKHLNAHGLYITWIIHACMCNIVVKNARVNYNGHQPFCFQPPLCLLNTPGYQLDLPPKASRVQSAYRPLPMRVHMRGTARCLIL